MKKIMDNLVKNISSFDPNIKKNYKILRLLQNIVSPNWINNKDYHDFILNVDNRDIRTRVFNFNHDSQNKKAIIFVHGGGWVIGSLSSYTKTCIEIAKKTKRLVISIDYRLAPEYPFPAGFNDCYDAIKLILNYLNEINIQNKDVCLMGDSAGANLIAAVSIKASKTKEFKVLQQVLIYPALQSDYSNNTKYKSVIEKGKDYFLTQKQLQDYISLYVKDEKDLSNPYVSPIKAKFLFFQPKTLLVTADNDPLRDEGKHYAKRLLLHFNNVTYCNIEGAMHGFLTRPLEEKYKEQVYNKIIQFLGDTNE